MIIAGPAAAQRVIRGYGADEDFQRQAIAADGDRTHQQDYAAAYPQQRASGNYGGGFLEFMMGGGRNPAPAAGYRGSYGGARYNDPYQQAGLLRPRRADGRSRPARHQPDLSTPRSGL